ncbi:hypothetical protein BAE36_02385 [Rhizobium leguminosarum bv. trifolii]|nr:hypothetical protein BAE36_02385 [Rhizobium leguminosarum bv. trifolii]
MVLNYELDLQIGRARHQDVERRLKTFSKLLKTRRENRVCLSRVDDYSSGTPVSSKFQRSGNNTARVFAAFGRKGCKINVEIWLIEGFDANVSFV